MLGKRLADLAPESLSRVVFSDNGSNAVEIALKVSFQFWQLVGKPEKCLVERVSWRHFRGDGGRKQRFVARTLSALVV